MISIAKRTCGRLPWGPVLAFALIASGIAFPQDNGKPAPPQQPAPKPGGQGTGGGSGGASGGVSVDVPGLIKDIFGHHFKVQLRSSTGKARAGDPIQFVAATSAQPGTPGLTYEFHWSADKDAPPYLQNQPGVNHFYSAPGKYTAWVVVYQNGKKLGVSNQLTEVVGPAPPGQVAQTPASVEVDMHMSLPPDHLGAGNIVVHNQCKEPERFEVASGQFPPFMRLAEGPSFEIAAHDQRPIELKFDSKGLKAGGHEGTAVVTCLTCKKTPDCVEVRQVVHVFLEVLPEVAKQDTGGSTGGGDAKPGDTKAGDTKTGDTKTTAVGPTPDKPHDPLPPDQTQKQPERSAKSTKHDPVPDVPLPAPPDQTGSAAAPVAPAPSLTLVLSQHGDVGKPIEFRAELKPEPSADPRPQYCFTWGDGAPPSCQSAPFAMHAYRSAGQYAVSVEATTNDLKVAAPVQTLAIQDGPRPAANRTPSALLIALVLAGLAAVAYGTHRVRRFLRGNVTACPDPGRHSLGPDDMKTGVRDGDGLHIRCVQSEARSEVSFTTTSETSEEYVHG